jgi:F-type H+-transporting ATPase subunit a
LLELVDGTAGRAAGRKIFPLIGGIFIFIAIANYLGVLPGVGTIGFYENEPVATAQHAATGNEVAAVGQAAAATAPAAAEEGHQVLVPFLRAPNADLNMTVGMALVTFVTVQILGIRQHGVAGRIKHMANPAFLFPIEGISEFSRIISLSARLFGNVFAGEILLGVMYAMASAVRVAIIPLAVPVVFIGLELLFGTIQALVFALLTLIYIVLATEGGHDDEHAAAHAPAPVAPQPQAHGAD